MASGKSNVSKEKTFKIASDPIYDGYQRGLASVVYKFFDKKSALLINLVEVVLQMNQIINKQMNFVNQLFENLKKGKFIYLLYTIFGMLIELICRHRANIITGISIYCVQMIC